MRGGEVGNDVYTDYFSKVTINGGVIEDDAIANEGVSVVVNQARVGDDVEAYDFSDISIYRGEFGEDVEVFDFATVSIFGGEFTGLPGDFDTGFGAFGPGASLWLSGTEFTIDGVPVPHQPHVPFELMGAGDLEGVLLDGSAFSVPFETGFDGAIYLVVPEPSMAYLQLGGLLAVACVWRRRRVRA